jgi:hypothetical protein
MQTQTLQQHVLWADDDPDDRSMINEVLRDINQPIDIRSRKWQGNPGLFI